MYQGFEWVIEIINLLNSVTLFKKESNSLDTLQTIEWFIERNCIVSDNEKIEAKTFHKACYESFGLTKQSFIGTRTFYDLVSQLGFAVKHGAKNKLYVFGITLKQ
jgi:hypothetical protein